jgi:hypothetical protein
MSQIQTFANNHSTQLARILNKLVHKHISYNPQLTIAFNQFQHSMYLHRVLYAYHKYSSKHSRHTQYMQAHYVRMLRSKPQQLVNCANTPTAYM